MFKDLVIEGIAKKDTLNIIKLLSESIEKGSCIPERISDKDITDKNYPDGYVSGQRCLKIYYRRV